MNVLPVGIRRPILNWRLLITKKGSFKLVKSHIQDHF